MWHCTPSKELIRIHIVQGSCNHIHEEGYNNKVDKAFYPAGLFLARNRRYMPGTCQRCLYFKVKLTLCGTLCMSDLIKLKL